MSASRSRTGSITCSRACAPRSRLKTVRRRSRHAAQQRRRTAPAARDDSGHPATCRSKSRCASRSSKSASTIRAPPSTACSPAPSPSSCRRLSNGRVVSRVVDGYALRRRDAAARPGCAPPTRLGDLLIETPSGWIPARQIADVKETDGPNQILRENGRRRIVVLANTDGTTDMAEHRAAHPRRAAGDASLPPGLPEPRRHIPGPGRGKPHDRDPCRSFRSR